MFHFYIVYHLLIFQSINSLSNFISPTYHPSIFLPSIIHLSLSVYLSTYQPPVSTQPSELLFSP